MPRVVLLLLAAFAPAPAAEAAARQFDCRFELTCQRVGCLRADLSLVYLWDDVTGEASLADAEVAAVPGENGVTFVEALLSGAVVATTVTTEGQAVHSRHTVAGGVLAASQYYGSCIVSEAP